MRDQEPLRRNVRLLVSYDGTDFHGSQAQPNARTVQSELEAAIYRVTGQQLRVTFAGRTDTGVHATGMVVNFNLLTDQAEQFFRRGLNAMLPEDLKVLSASFVPFEFHARFAARERHYCYFLVNGPVLPPLWRHHAGHLYRSLDLTAMNLATALLLGEHDFASFCGDGKGVPLKEPEQEEVNVKTKQRMSTIREIRQAKWTMQPLELADNEEGRLLKFTIAANGFLPHMVRNIVGTLSEVGLGKLEPAKFGEILAAADRRKGGPTAPAKGLCLTHIFY